MKALIRKILFGDTEISEYSKITVPGDIEEKVHLETSGNIIDISKNHWLLCIDPVVFGIWLDNDGSTSGLTKNRKYKIYFNHSATDIKDIKKKSVAVLTLIFFDVIEEENGMLLLLKVQSSKIYHLNFINTYLLFSRYYKKNGLTFSKFKSFVAAYSYPRQIKIVSFRQDDYYNIFPMDLLGNIDKGDRCVFGLRHTNLSLAGIIETGRLAVSDVPFHYKDLVYQLGKHHSSTPPPLNSLSFQLVKSKNFEFYIPAWVENYKEVKILKTLNLGSHMLLWGESKHKNIINHEGSHLFLIHFLHHLSQKKNGMAYPLV
jgi:hypothetical protein